MTERRREFWKHIPTGEVWAVELEGDTPVRACGPVAAPDVNELAFQTLLDHLPFETRDVDWLRQHRGDFMRYEPGG